MNKIVTLRDPIPADLSYLLNMENDLSNQIYSNYPKFHSQEEIENFISKKQDIFMEFQYRYMILFDSKTVGCIDLFDFDLINSRVGLGIIIDENNRNKGIALLAIDKIKTLISEEYLLNQIYVEVLADNLSSNKLFKKSKFILSGCKKKWIRKEDLYIDLNIYQYFYS
jgi:diamine N-acetyltransferase